MYFTNISTYIIIFSGFLTSVELATFTVEDKSVMEYIQKENPALYIDLDGVVKSRDMYRDFQEYGVPSDVAHTYIPRGMKVGDLFASNRERKVNDDDDDSSFDPWTIVWYIGSFGGLIAFFLVVSCSEWCCLKSRASRTASRHGPTMAANYGSRSRALASGTVHDTPPPSYHLFAPPSYDSLSYSGLEKTEKFDIFVVPVHRISATFTERNENSAEDSYNTPRIEEHSTANPVDPPAYSVIAIPPNS